MKLLVLFLVAAVAAAQNNNVFRVAPLSYYSNYQPASYSQQPLFRTAAPQARILQQVQQADPTGPYRTQYSTENGISSTEEGYLSAFGPEGPAVVKRGSYSYPGPDGVQYTVTWVADENGYRASGAHLPQAPEVPVLEAQRRSLYAFNPLTARPAAFYKK